MAKSIFYIDALLQNEKKNISELSNQLITLLHELSKVDQSFNFFEYVREGFSSVSIDIDDFGLDKAKEQLAVAILESNRADVRKHEKENNLSLSFSRDFGFSHLLQFYKNKVKSFSATGNLATSNYPGFRLEYFNMDCNYSLAWYTDVLKCLVKVLSPKQAGIMIKLPGFVEDWNNLEIRYPFGWLTYFSNDNEIQIPDDLSGVDYEDSGDGKYILLTREDFTVSKEAYEMQRDRLLAVMKEVKERVPEYSL